MSLTNNQLEIVTLENEGQDATAIRELIEALSTEDAQP